jgi:hypothetical protein
MVQALGVPYGATGQYVLDGFRMSWILTRDFNENEKDYSNRKINY